MATVHQQLSAMTAPGLSRDFAPSDSSIATKLVVVGYLVTALFLGSVVAWAAFVPISSAAIAAGVVGKEGYRKIVQHLEGGIIQNILVKDGDTVEAGQTLIELADVQSRADFDLLEKQKAIATAKELSLVTAQLGQDEVKLPDWLDPERLDPSVRDAINGQIEAMMLANRLHYEQLDIIDRQIRVARQKAAALNEETLALERSLQLVQREYAENAELQRQGLITRKVVFDLQRQASDTEVEYRSNKVAVQSTRQEVSDLEMERSQLVALHSRRLGEELDKVREQLVQLDEKLSKTQDTLGRTIIRAPTSGIVVNLRVNTVGGVISSGEPLLEIVPSSGQLIVEARVDPNDRDSVQVGQKAEVRFSAFNRRLTEPVQGRVALISADRLVDSVTNEGYYQAQIELLEDPEEVLNGGRVYPGMQAETLIITGSRTALSYLVQPVVGSFNRAFRED